MAVHTSGVSNEPPWQMKPASITQSELHPSPLAVLLSSQPSGGLIDTTRRASPQIGVHVSRPPTPDPSVFDERHANPTSITSHSALQPSPLSVLLSSHTSAVDRMPLPQMCTTGVKSRLVSFACAA